MIYAEYDKLTVLKLENHEDYIHMDILSKFMLEKPSNVIYCELNDKLYGIISMGDIARATEIGGRVAINKNFTCISKNDYMKARDIFHKKKSINALPVVSGESTLIGAYLRWDDLLFMENAQYWEGKLVCNRSKKIVLVHPRTLFAERNRVFQWFKKYLIAVGINVECIYNENVGNYLNYADYILFTSEEEARAMDTLYAYVLNKDFGKTKFFTYKNFIEECINERICLYLYNLIEAGIYIFNLVFDVNDKNKRYFKLLKQNIYRRHNVIGEKVTGKLHEDMYPDFFDDLYSPEYVNDIMQIKYLVETQSGCARLKEYHGKYYNVIKGERYTVEQPDIYKRTVYFVGACYVYGHYGEDKNTIESCLQRLINQSGYKVRVVNCGSPAYAYKGKEILVLARIMSLPLKKGDIIIYGGGGCQGVDKINLLDVCERNNVSAKWMIDHPMHCNHRLHALYGEAIYDTIESILLSDIEEQGKIDAENDFITKLYINQYFKGDECIIYDRIGSIVMNCNPFTYGHRYLIECALKVVEFLIIFVVEEDESLFSFEERYAMVYNGTLDLDNIIVVPSGCFILSRTTFPEYFIKELKENTASKIEDEITLFAERIAIGLNISYRFVGEEKEDIVTNAYNLAMKNILPQKGIKLVEIPRKKIDNKRISASSVREYLEKNETDKIRKLVPESTWNIIFKMDE